MMDMRRALKDRLANYKVPQEMKVVQDGLPRNAMGKGTWTASPSLLLLSNSSAVNKKSLVKEVFGEAVGQ